MIAQTQTRKGEEEFLKARRWFFLACFCLINFCTGALYLWSIFSIPLAQRMSEILGMPVAAADLSPVFGLAGGLTPFLMIAGGFVNDRFGPRWVISTGGALLGIGYWLAAGAESLLMLYVGYGVFVGAGTGLINGCTINTSVKLFPDRRGFAGGTVTAALGVGAAVLPFAAAGLLNLTGIEVSLMIFGAVSAVVIVPLGLFAKRVPDGFMTPAAKETGADAEGKNWVEMIRTPTFWPLAFLFTTSAIMGLMMISNLSGIASSQIGLAASGAAIAVSVLSIANTAGRFVSGLISDVLGRIPALAIALVCALAGFLLLLNARTGDAAFFFIGIVGIGLCFGAFVGIFPGLIADEYGARHNSVNLSILFLGYSVGGFIGPVLVKWAAGQGGMPPHTGLRSVSRLPGSYLPGFISCFAVLPVKRFRKALFKPRMRDFI
ncbi:OFA family MFS transporter [Sutterella faecalis]|uniref:OFA family MFS transporter n=1 Tax=Sutterella faecalis TaxID=2584944 RepID=A0ABX5VEA1_9BURK|nr:OFA family MFS transporter [Sutterella faecalis]QDA54007.1 OFA family MFS transporter [Sutterella faecalis]